ncbi:hypothetical protein, partial [Thermosulfuriphilus sp.]
EYRGFGKGHYRWYQRAVDSGIRIIRAEELGLSEESNYDLVVDYRLGSRREFFKAGLVILGHWSEAPQPNGSPLKDLWP